MSGLKQQIFLLPVEYVIPIPIPTGEPIEFGWAGLLSREFTIQQLQGKPVGTFLVRYSPHRMCFVISFVEQNNKIQHIDGIFLENGIVTVTDPDNNKIEYSSMTECVKKKFLEMNVKPVAIGLL